jgi:lysosomal acid lipase/cholesteryl ester hydrolase
MPEPRRNLGFVLADAGYDVWLANNRGNKYSSAHKALTKSDLEYWNFSLDDLATYDVPAIIDYVLNITGHKKAACWGFSQGTAQLFAALSLYEDINRRVSVFMAMAPSMKPDPQFCPSVSWLTKTCGPEVYSDYLTCSLYFLGTKSFVGIEERIIAIKNPYITILNRYIVSAALRYALNWTLDSAVDKLPSQEALAIRTLICKNLFSTSSMKNVVHWFQMVKGGFFGI